MQINSLEQDMTANKKLIELADTLSRLESNPDYIKIITEGYLVDAAIRLVAFKGSPACYGQVEEDTDKDILAIGKFRNYLATIRRNALQAEHTNKQILEELAELEQEEVGE